LNIAKSKIKNALESFSATETYDYYGRITNVVGLILEARIPNIALGGLCSIYPSFDSEPIGAEVVGFNGENVLLMPLGDVRGVRPGSRVKLEESQPYISVGNELLGRVLDGMGNPIDGKGEIKFKNNEKIIYIKCLLILFQEG
jgi:flagellum-specific ATP synthase